MLTHGTNVRKAEWLCIVITFGSYTVKGHNLTFFRPVAVSLYRRVGFIQGHPHP